MVLTTDWPDQPLPCACKFAQISVWSVMNRTGNYRTIQKSPGTFQKHLESNTSPIRKTQCPCDWFMSAGTSFLGSAQTDTSGCTLSRTVGFWQRCWSCITWMLQFDVHSCSTLISTVLLMFHRQFAQVFTFFVDVLWSWKGRVKSSVNAGTSCFFCYVDLGWSWLAWNLQVNPLPIIMS